MILICLVKFFLINNIILLDLVLESFCLFFIKVIKLGIVIVFELFVFVFVKLRMLKLDMKWLNLL